MSRNKKNLHWKKLRTKPVIKRIVAAQKNAAAAAGVGFFNTFEAMGGDGTMATWVKIPSIPAMSVVANIFGEEPGKAAPILILMFINIHHYFTDGVIWHISNPDVRKELFAHVPKQKKR